MSCLHGQGLMLRQLSGTLPVNLVQAMGQGMIDLFFENETTFFLSVRLVSPLAFFCS